MKIDFKKTEKELYLPKTKPSIIDVPEMTFITVAGKGDPNNSAEYIAAVQLLYGLSYTIKMGNKDILDYVVPPLEGLWTVDGDFKGGGATIDDKSKFIWTMMIHQHHEIYISDPRRTAPEKLKTVLRHPIRRMQSIQK